MRCDHSRREDIQGENIEQQDQCQQGQNGKQRTGAFLVVRRHHVLGAIGKRFTLGHIFFDHDGGKKGGHGNLRDTGYNASAETGVRRGAQSLHGQDVHQLRRTGTGHGKGVDTAAEDSHDKTLGDAGTLHQAQRDGVHGDEGDQSVQTTIG